MPPVWVRVMMACSGLRVLPSSWRFVLCRGSRLLLSSLQVRFRVRIWHVYVRLCFYVYVRGLFGVSRTLRTFHSSPLQNIS